MRRAILTSVVGSNARRVAALAKQPRRPRFRLGELVRDRYDDVGAVSAIYADLTAVDDAGIVDNIDAWLRDLDDRPRTPRSGIWYSIVFGEGEGLVGERDLQLAKPKPKPPKQQPKSRSKR